MSYAYADRVVWVDDLAADAHPMVHDLCATHASTVGVPRGWELSDLRNSVAVASTSSGPGQLDLVGA